MREIICVLIRIKIRWALVNSNMQQHVFIAELLLLSFHMRSNNAPPQKMNLTERFYQHIALREHGRNEVTILS